MNSEQELNLEKKSPWQFSLYSLLAFTTVCAVLLSVWKTVPGIFSILFNLLAIGLLFGLVLVLVIALLFSGSWLLVSLFELVMEAFAPKRLRDAQRRGDRDPPA